MAHAGPLTARRGGRTLGRRRALRARVAGKPGGRRLRHLRPRHRPLHAARRASAGAGRRRQPVLPARRVRPDRVPVRGRSRSCSRRSRAARAWAGTSTTTGLFRGTERFFRPGYRGPSRGRVDPGARRRPGEAREGRQGGRRRLRPRRLDDHHGRGVPELRVLRLRLPRAVDRAGPRGSQGSRAWTSASRSTWPPPRTSRVDGYDLVCVFDCLHDMGDPVGRAGARPRDARRRRHLDDRRAVRRGQRARTTSTLSGGSSTAPRR